jgi:hypothetical protein
MKMRNNYRFTIQWGADSAEKIEAGEALKNFGNRKSKLIVAAVSEYIKSYPESLSPGCSLDTGVEPVLTRGKVEEIVREMIDARLASIKPIAHTHAKVDKLDTADNGDIDTMIQNLDLFAQ